MRKFRWLLAVSTLVLCSGCRTVLPSDQPSRLWDVYLQRGRIDSKISIQRPTRMVRANIGKCDQTNVIPPGRIGIPNKF